MSSLKLSIIGLSIIVLAGCSGKGSGLSPQGTSVGNGFRMTISADLTGASALTTAIPGKSTDPHKTLYKILPGQPGEKAGIQPVLSGPNDIYHWKETATHVIAQTTIDENGSRCYLIAIPKVQEKSQVLCLSREPLDQDRYNPTGDTKRPLFDVQGVGVFFSSVQREYANGVYSEPTNRISELRYWDGKSESVQTIFHTDRNFNKNPAIEGVWASQDGKKVCFGFAESDPYYSGIEEGKGAVYCRNRDDEDRWKLLANIRSNKRATKFNNHVLFDGYSSQAGVSKLNLDTLVLEDRKGPIPTVKDYELEEGGFIGRGAYGGDYGSIVCVDKNGDGKALPAQGSDNTSLARIDDWAWFFGSQTLQRVSLKNCELDPKNYFANTRLIQLSELNWVLGDFLKLNGTSDRGLPTTVHLTAAGSLIQINSQAVTVEHPIDLKWDLP